MSNNWNSCMIVDKIHLKIKGKNISRGKEGHCILICGSFCQGKFNNSKIIRA